MFSTMKQEQLFWDMITSKSEEDLQQWQGELEVLESSLCESNNEINSYQSTIKRAIKKIEETKTDLSVDIDKRVKIISEQSTKIDVAKSSIHTISEYKSNIELEITEKKRLISALRGSLDSRLKQHELVEIFKNDVEPYQEKYCEGLKKLFKKAQELNVQSLAPYVIENMKGVQILDDSVVWDVQTISYRENSKTNKIATLINR